MNLEDIEKYLVSLYDEKRSVYYSLQELIDFLELSDEDIIKAVRLELGEVLEIKDMEAKIKVSEDYMALK